MRNVKMKMNFNNLSKIRFKTKQIVGARRTINKLQELDSEIRILSVESVDFIGTTLFSPQSKTSII